MGGCGAGVPEVRFLGSPGAVVVTCHHLDRPASAPSWGCCSGLLVCARCALSLHSLPQGQPLVTRMTVRLGRPCWPVASSPQQASTQPFLQGAAEPAPAPLGPCSQGVLFPPNCSSSQNGVAPSSGLGWQWQRSGPPECWLCSCPGCAWLKPVQGP